MSAVGRPANAPKFHDQDRVRIAFQPPDTPLRQAVNGRTGRADAFRGLYLIELDEPVVGPEGEIADVWCPEDALEPVALYSRAEHAAHHEGLPGQGHDLERWDVIQAWDDPRPSDVPRDADKHSGYLDSDRRQHVLYLRTAPFTPKADCAICKYDARAEGSAA